MRTLLLLLLSALAVRAAVPGPPTTSFTRGMLTNSDAASVRSYIGAGAGTNSLVISQNGTNSGTEINVQDTATLTWARGGSNWTANVVGGSGDTTATNIVTLTMAGTNVSSMNYALVSRGGVFKLVMTGNAYIGAPSGVANTAFTKAWLMVQQPSTGTCVLTFTNGFYAFSEGVLPIIDTNNGAVSVFEFVSDVFTNGLLHGSVSTPSKLIP